MPEARMESKEVTTIHIPSILFGQPEPVWFLVNGKPVVRFQDVPLSSTLMGRYTTFNGQGMLSVYASPFDWTNDLQDKVADSDRTILTDEHGNPTEVTGIQRYFPPSVMCPAYWSPEQGVWWKSTEGVAAYRPGDNYPELSDAVCPYRHDNVIWFEKSGNELVMHHDEVFWYFRHTSPVGAAEWVMEYDRGFLYRVADRKLLQFTDNLNRRVYERQG